MKVLISLGKGVNLRI